jgi:Helix-turn-helix domain
MPWRECSVMDERMQFVARRLAGEPMAELCREFGISRKTGYKLFDRYQECGVQGLTDRSRRPYRYANQLPFQVENFILNMSASTPAGVLERFASACSADSRAFRSRPKARSMPCWIATAWSNAAVACVVVCKALRCLWDSGPTISGAPTTKASSCWEITNTATRSPSPTTPAAFSSLVKRFLPPRKTTLSLYLSACSKIVACPPTSAATTACPSLPHTPCSI